MARELEIDHLEEARQTGVSPHAEEARRSKSTNTLTNLPEAPRSASFRLPLKMTDVQIKQVPPPKLLHPLLNKIPMQVRFGINGFLCNAVFMVAYHLSVAKFEHMANPSTIYSIVYLFFIPIGHALISLLVFGWPERYIPSLMSNFPIGLTAIALGAALTAYLDKIEFNDRAVELMVKASWTYWGSKPETTATSEGENGEFYSSLLVLFVTGIWTFVLSVVINSPTEPTHKKEL